MEAAWVLAKISKVPANRYIGYGRKYVPYRWRQVLHTSSGGGKPLLVGYVLTPVPYVPVGGNLADLGGNPLCIHL